MARRRQREALFLSEHPKPPPDCVVATIDGAARGNPGPAAYGVLFEDRKGAVLAQLSSRLGKTTNNVAEYRALLAALAFARKKGWQALEVRTDSELLAQQLRGAYRVRSPELKPLHEEAQQLIACLDFFVVEAVPRKLTRPADKLANAALDSRRRSRAPRPTKTPGRAAPSTRTVPTRGKPGGHGLSRAEKGPGEEGALAPEEKSIRAVYQAGVLKPQEPLDLPEGEVVDLTIRRQH